MQGGLYDRQLAMPEIGAEGQARLAKASVLVAGAGGLGSAIASYLAAAGVGRLVVVDRDVVELSNLNRQLLYYPADIGKAKATQARRLLQERHPDVVVEAIVGDVAGPELQAALGSVQVVVDGLDSFSARRELHALAFKRGLPFIHGAAAGFEGRMLTVLPPGKPCLACFLGEAPDSGPVPIVGATAGLVGCMQAIEAIKMVLGRRLSLVGRLLVVDAMAWRWHSFEIAPRRACPVCDDADSQLDEVPR